MFAFFRKQCYSIMLRRVGTVATRSTHYILPPPRGSELDVDCEVECRCTRDGIVECAQRPLHKHITFGRIKPYKERAM